MFVSVSRCLCVKSTVCVIVWSVSVCVKCTSQVKAIAGLLELYIKSVTAHLFLTCNRAECTSAEEDPGMSPGPPLRGLRVRHPLDNARLQPDHSSLHAQVQC